MAKKADNIFRVTGTAVDSYSGAADFTTDAMDLRKYDGRWVLYCSSDHTSGTPQITIQVSDDNADWFDYQAESTNVDIPNWFYDDKMVHKYLRIQYVSNSSNGNVSLKFVQND